MWHLKKQEYWFAVVTMQTKCYLAYTVVCNFSIIDYFLLPFFPNLATTRRLRLKEFIYQFCLYIYIMPLNLTANSNVVGKTVQGLTKIRSKRFEKQVARTCPKKIKLVWICRTSHTDQSLVPATRFWSSNYEFTRWDLSLQLVRESSFNMTRGDEDIETWSLKF